ncbi:MAG: hypothetical protein H6822_27575 [Planctomycetaceae bacterium]|nr:hypothetical protein [Planctomycetales bacterium]MCB9925941.1 hypothetical protein [Planctomycetaceae bacterium]
MVRKITGWMFSLALIVLLVGCGGSESGPLVPEEDTTSTGAEQAMPDPGTEDGDSGDASTQAAPPADPGTE